VSFVVGETEAGLRADIALSTLAGISRSQARRWIDADLVRLNAGRCRASEHVQTGDTLDATPPEPLPSPLAPEALAIDVLYEDEDVVVVNKAAGLVVHPGPGHPGGTLVNALLHHCGTLAGVGGVERPGIVHRLDRGTSGVMVVAKNDQAHRGLAEQFHDHRVERVYRALVRGVPGADSGRIERRIGRHPRDRKRMSVRGVAAREAVTAWRVLRRFAACGRSWIELRPETGRTHQIRVHLASAGLPIEGDPVYGRPRGAGGVQRRGGFALALTRPALHAAVLAFTHPRRAARVRFEAPLPPDLEAALAELDRREGRTP
jgi:23S rRNA pseudouridine1911/1915/1917 synthase